uniref:Uncharacterized protein n=1 Tax=Oryza sativa subsp. japonica TaxID=39947 RepID=Q69T97_ORYSJ|nr:hypothetical protein [Oryza sativa Japonica Group]BAD61871.1 hypothetical protein [Oryza sativa Japonica Group]
MKMNTLTKTLMSPPPSPPPLPSPSPAAASTAARAPDLREGEGVVAASKGDEGGAEEKDQRWIRAAWSTASRSERREPGSTVDDVEDPPPSWPLPVAVVTVASPPWFPTPRGGGGGGGGEGMERPLSVAANENRAIFLWRASKCGRQRKPIFASDRKKDEELNPSTVADWLDCRQRIVRSQADITHIRSAKADKT